ncbi:MAG: CoA-binding protein [Crenarchaeota archaeon]|nr:CoA-binding protein [Thermoproteota archaeon]
MARDLRPFFEPRSVAVIGASEKPGTVGRAIMTNLLERYRGKVYPVNIKYDKVFGLKCYRSILEIPDEIDLAVIAVPADVVPKVAEECGRKGVKALLVISAGFKEIGGVGVERERKLLEVVRRYGMSMIGPNCLGIYDPYSGLDTIFNPSDRQGKPGPGSVAFISQSGALGAALLDWFTEQGIGLSKFVSYGNAADVDESDLIEYLVEDERTKVISAYIEGVKDGRKFMRAVAKAVASGKPVVVLKAGRTERGVKAAASHTGSLAGSYSVFRGALAQSGAVVVNDLLELLIAVRALETGWKVPGPRVAIVTNGGGAGVLATDAIETLGLKMAELSNDTIEELRKALPPAASPYNPVDVLGDAPADRYEKAIEIVSRDPNVDMIMVIALMQAPAIDPSALLNVLKRAKESTLKPIVFVAPGGGYAYKHLLEVQRLGIPSFRDPIEAAKALSYLYTFSNAIDRVKKYLQILT